MKTITVLRDSFLTSFSRWVAVLLLFLVVCFGFSPTAQAVSPTPDGGYSGGNTAEGGAGALFSLTSGSNNTALGSQALYSVTSGTQNTATGAQALKNNLASNNTADGFQALVNNTTGHANAATGYRALFSNTTGKLNTANAAVALYHNTTGVSNTATGYEALRLNTTGSANTATGLSALNSHTTGDQNTATGAAALSSNTAGSFNTGDGAYALFNLATGSNNIALGIAAGCNLIGGNNNIYIGSLGGGDESDTIRIGTSPGPSCLGFINPGYTATYIDGIAGTPLTGAAVVIQGDGHLGVAASSSRFKDKIAAMDKASEAILALKPVTFYYKKEIDPERTAQFGLVAEEVEKVNPALITHDRDGKPYTVRYDAVNAMLLNEFLKAHRTIEEQHDAIAELKSEVKTLTAAFKQQATEVQAMRAQLRMSKFATGRIRRGGAAPQLIVRQ